jgi:hypothetical protein
LKNSLIQDAVEEIPTKPVFQPFVIPLPLLGSTVAGFPHDGVRLASTSVSYPHDHWPLVPFRRVRD